jgi:hypothetical protein
MSTTTTDIPEWMRPYSQELLAKADALTSTPYQSYGGERVAQFTPLQKTAFGRAEGQQVAGQIGTATGLAGLAGASSFTAPGTAGQFMSPYMQNVVEMQQRDAQRQADIAGTQRGAQAVRAGAFGGSRQAIMDAEAGRNLSQQMGDIQTTGLQSAFDRAQQQFNAEQANRLQAGQVLGQLGQQQFGQEMDITGQQAQFGGQQRQATQDILNTQYQDFLNKQRAPYDQLSFMSGIFRGTPMGQTTTTTDPKASSTSQLVGLGTAAAGLYGSYLDNQTAKTPVRAAGGPVYSYAAGGIASLNQPEMAAMAGGMSDQQLQQVAQSPNRPELEKLTFAAQQQKNDDLRMQTEAMRAKGNVSNITSTLAQMPDAQLQQYAKLNKNDPYVMALVVAEAKRRKEGGMPSQEAPTVVDQQIAGMAMPEEQGIAQLPVGNMEFAGGGIIAFEGGGAIVLPAGTPNWMIEQARLENPDREVRSEDEGSVFRAIGRGLTYSSDVEARKAKEMAAKAPTSSAAPVTAGLDAALMTDEARKRAPGQAAAQAAKVSTGDDSGDRMSAPPGIGGLGDVMKMIDAEQARGIAAQEMIGKQSAADIAAARGELSEAEKMAREFGAEREARLKKQEEGLNKSEKSNFNMTLIEIGLAMMAGKSPDAIQNIAAGAQQGLKGYQGRLEKIQSGREKLDESMARLAEIREEKLSAVGESKRQLNALERKALLDSKIAQEQIASGVAGQKITITAEQARQANNRSFEIWKYKQDRSDAEQKGARSEAQAISVNLRAIADEANSAMRNLTPGEPEYVALAAQRDMALAQLAKMSGLKSGSTATSRLRFDARGNPIQ